ncbi:MAG: hypothetical protein AABY87_11370 [bacterium]
MKKILDSIWILISAFALIAGCKTETPQTQKSQPPAAAQPTQAEPTTAGYRGTVVDVINSGGYTYVQVDTGSGKIWAAANQFEVKAGDQVMVPQGLPMENFHSKTLNRTFDTIYFVSAITVAGADKTAVQTPEGHPDVSQGHTAPSSHAPSVVDFPGLKKAEGGKTVAEIYAEKNSLSGKNVTVRGKVVKFTPAIMGKNWLHLQDGTGDQGTLDMTITTDGTAKIGDTVLVSGVLAVNKDFGAGYQYDVIIEDAKLTVE